jgi:hypothetical protein
LNRRLAPPEVDDARLPAELGVVLGVVEGHGLQRLGLDRALDEGAGLGEKWELLGR